MSHGVHAVQHEVEHQLEHEEHGHGGGHDKPPERNNRKIALLISVIALCLAFSETLGKSAQTAAISDNVEAANLWAFFQAKTIRRTLVEAAAQEMTIGSLAVADEAAKAAMAKQIALWKSEAARYRSEPSTREGSTELAARAKYHHYEVASAAYQIGIVLASAAVITSIVLLAYAAAGLGVIGLVFTGIGLFAPHSVHLL